MRVAIDGRSENGERRTMNRNDTVELGTGNGEPGTVPAFKAQRRHGSRTAIASPLLSVVMPVFNELATIDEIIARVLGVSMRVELIVVEP